MTHDRLILVLGTPSGGTSVVAGILHHLGVDMGESFPRSRRGYEVFEDTTLRKRYSIDAPEGDVTREIIPSQEQPWRRFRDYCEDRLARAKGRPCGIKIGATCWLGDPNPASLPIRIVRVTRPLEDSIRSNWRYGGQTGQEAIRRAMQVAGYWAACQQLCETFEPVWEHDYRHLIQNEALTVFSLIEAIDISPTESQCSAAREFIDPELRHV